MITDPISYQPKKNQQTTPNQYSNRDVDRDPSPVFVAISPPVLKRNTGTLAYTQFLPSFLSSHEPSVQLHDNTHDDDLKAAYCHQSKYDTQHQSDEANNDSNTYVTAPTFMTSTIIDKAILA